MLTARHVGLRLFGKVALAYALHYLGILHLWRRIVLKNRAVVLMYHRVLTAGEWEASGSHPGIVVTRETFSQHLAILRRYFCVLTPARFAHHLETQTPFPDSSCLITFDDGWLDNLSNGAGHLEQAQLTAVMFLPVNYLSTQRCFWRESLAHLVAAAARRVEARVGTRSALAEALRPFGLEPALDLRGPHLMEQVIQAVAGVNLRRDEAEQLVTNLSAALGVDVRDLAGPDRLLAWSDLPRLARAGFTFASHGSEHLRLADVADDVARDDIMHSRGVLKTVADSALAFSYPNGSWTPAVAAQVRAAGFQFAFTTEPGFISVHDDPMSLNRVNVHEDATFAPPLFLSRILGLF